MLGRLSLTGRALGRKPQIDSLAHQTPFPFLFDGAQYDPTGYYGEYSPQLAHSVRGNVMPYTGQGSNEFGHAPGELLPVFHRTPTPWGRIGIDSAEVLLQLKGGMNFNDNRFDVFNWKAALASLPFVDLLEAIFEVGRAPIHPPSWYKRAHPPECHFMGVSGLCADESRIQYPTGQLMNVAEQSQEPRPAYPSNPVSGGRVVRTGLTDCLKLVWKARQFENAVQECQKEYSNCDEINDPLEALGCQQDFAEKYGAPADPSAAIGKCAYQKSGVCVSGAFDAQGCASP